PSPHVRLVLRLPPLLPLTLDFALHPKTTARRRTPASPKPLTRCLDRTNVQASPGPIPSESRTRAVAFPGLSRSYWRSVDN
ncbi:hypothetical protein BC827DRAFT_1254877, partial [Russula dissimulans]